MNNSLAASNKGAMKKIGIFRNETKAITFPSGCFCFLTILIPNRKLIDATTVMVAISSSERYGIMSKIIV